MVVIRSRGARVMLFMATVKRAASNLLVRSRFVLLEITLGMGRTVIAHAHPRGDEQGRSQED